MFNLSWKYWQHLHITFYRTWSCEHAIFISITLISGVSQSPTGIVNVVQRGLYISTLYLVINHSTDINKIFSVSYYRNWSCAPVIYLIITLINGFPEQSKWHCDGIFSSTFIMHVHNFMSCRRLCVSVANIFKIN
jgi:hypothetical protein